MGKLQIICGRTKPYLRRSFKDGEWYLDNGSEFNIIPKEDIKRNGRIVAECDFRIELINPEKADKIDRFYRDARITYNQLKRYLKGKDGYAIIIDEIRIYSLEKAPKMSDFGIMSRHCNFLQHCNNGDFAIKLPSETVFRLLTGEQRIIVKNRIIKGMVRNGL